jgi:hypothetical protein
MLSTISIDSTENLETSFAGVLRNSYTKPCNPKLSHERVKNNDISFSIAPYVATDIVQSPPQKLSKNKRQYGFIDDIFLQRGAAYFQYLQEEEISIAPSYHRIPEKIKESLEKLCRESNNTNTIYELSELILEWLFDVSNESHALVSKYITLMPPVNLQIFIATLCDGEFSTENESLLYSVSLFLKSNDKHLAQTSATFLFSCGGNLGKQLLLQAISSSELPHVKLIQGIKTLLS